MDVKLISRKLDPRDVIIKLVDGSSVKGKINLHYDGFMIQRVSEIFTKIPDPFITVFEATVEGEGGKVVIVNKRFISWVMPHGDQS